MEHALHGVQIHEQRFKKLRRQIGALEKQHKPVDFALKKELLELDGWLCKNKPGWHTNFPAKPTNSTVPISTTAK